MLRGCKVSTRWSLESPELAEINFIHCALHIGPHRAANAGVRMCQSTLLAFYQGSS